MEQKASSQVLQVTGMTCSNCEQRLESKLEKTAGVMKARASYNNSTVEVIYDANIISLDRISALIERLDYRVRKQSSASNPANTEDEAISIDLLLGIGIVFAAGYLVVKNTVGFDFIPQVTQNMGYGILFVIGLLTSIHCITMCGGINLAQCITYRSSEGDTGKLSKMKPSLMYNAGRVVSYTIIGGVAGALGSVVSFSGTAKGSVAIVSGLLMMVMGLNMLNVAPWLRRFNPRIPKVFGNQIHRAQSSNGPFYVGLLNGLMPCGPLQAMQLFALGTGSFLGGAGAMLSFSLGTFPLMFGFGAISSLLSGKFTRQMMKVSAVFVIALGVVMLSRGLNLSGFGLPNRAIYAQPKSGNIAKVEGDVQYVTTTLASGRYPPFVVQKGVPVRWIMRVSASELNGCNNALTIPQYGVTKKLEPGDNLIEFTPGEEGVVTYTCWMGMIRSSIQVVPNIGEVSDI